jgi:hypothetical protein
LVYEVWFGEFFKVWHKIGCVNSGGPVSQIAMMHHTGSISALISSPARPRSRASGAA